jgi:hypothetical protein
MMDESTDRIANREQIPSSSNRHIYGSSDQNETFSYRINVLMLTEPVEIAVVSPTYLLCVFHRPLIRMLLS